VRLKANVRKAVPSDRQLGQLATPRQAIRTFCLRCMGWAEGEPVPIRDVKDCTSPGCWLFPYRLGPGTRPQVEKCVPEGKSAVQRAESTMKGV